MQQTIAARECGFGGEGEGFLRGRAPVAERREEAVAFHSRITENKHAIVAKRNSQFKTGAVQLQLFWPWSGYLEPLELLEPLL